MPEVLKVDDVSFVRGGRPLLSDIDLSVRAGEHWALIGPNGAGKSTLLSLCGAVQHPTTGTVTVLGARLGRVDVRDLRRLIGHVNPRHPLTSALTVEEVVLTGATGSVELVPRWEASRDERQRARELMGLLGIAEIAGERWPTLSQGERGRTLIGRALLPDPALLLLDEPSTGLDVAARERLLRTLDELRSIHPDLASVLVTHHLEELPSSTTHAMLLRGGRTTASGAAVDVLTTTNVTEAFDYPIAIDYSETRWTAKASSSTR
ncbi:MAG: ATP-binding cassette domain-containing protein [Lacisediminihabitans sp.]